ncbi:uncharacterized protein PG986_009761 [Apiospora aurea]|uniref:F-box domain-containing protein n=1 Tax=Apiospora aurea TaxID=335848 RepID=A0ABR1Q8M1_9PEZI
MAYIAGFLALTTVLNSQRSYGSLPRSYGSRSDPLPSDVADSSASLASPDAKSNGIRRYRRLVPDWARKQWRRLRPLKPQPKPLWWLRMQHNLVLSPLHRLPEEIMLEICRDPDGSDVYIMRQTCSLFRRILSDPEFVGPVQTQYFMRSSPPVLNLPHRQVGWEDVFERLRRRRCCSACVDARLPGQVGFEAGSAYDTTMFWMANETKYCIECQVPHHLITFSKSQREVEGGAICIMVEGGVAICPHHTVSLRQLLEWRKVIRSNNHPSPPWFLRCDLCFQEFEEPLRYSAVQPSATCLSPETIKLPDHLKGTAIQGALCVQWTIPLRVKTKAAVAAATTAFDYRVGEHESHGAEKIEEALTQAAEAGYNNLLCPHISFDGLPIFHNFVIPGKVNWI